MGLVRRVTFSLAFLSLTVVALPAAASHLGIVTASAYRDPPPGFAIRVGVFDDSDLNLSIRDRLGEALKATGHLVDASGQMPLMLETESVNRKEFRTERSLGHGTIEGAGDPNYGAWRSPEADVFGDYERQIVTGFTSYFHIRATLRDPDDNKIIWVGDVYGHLGNQRPQALVPTLVRELAAAYGQTVKRREFEF
jgi:hypothetical protein